jgi:DNA-binding NarL/FixJ family response regulator
MIRVLVADDHPAFRRGLELMLGDIADLEVVGGEDGVVVLEHGEHHDGGRWPGISLQTSC